MSATEKHSSAADRPRAEVRSRRLNTGLLTVPRGPAQDEDDARARRISESIAVELVKSAPARASRTSCAARAVSVARRSCGPEHLSPPTSKFSEVTPRPKTIASSRSGAGYDAHSYHTKVPPAAIARLIGDKLPHGGVVGDAYCGSGTTGIGAAIAERASFATYDVYLGDLSPFASFLAAVQNSPPALDLFERDARRVLREVEEDLRLVWQTTHSDGRVATVLYVVWSEVLLCPACGSGERFWDIGVDHEQGAVRRLLTCGSCRRDFRKDEARRQTEQVRDPLLGHLFQRPVRVPVQVAYEIDGRKHLKEPDDGDMAAIDAANALKAPTQCPNRRMLDRDSPWGDLYRGGYHEGVTHVHHFYTWRNFVTLGRLWSSAAETETSRAVKFLVSSYNLSHSTLMSRLVFKRGQREPVLTGYQTGALYISSLPVEKNPVVGIQRSKLPAVMRGFAVTCDRRGVVKVDTKAAQDWRDSGADVDYFFLDPPFGGNIPYAEANFIAEAWLGQVTVPADEAIMSRFQGKSADDYRDLLAGGFAALSERLSPTGSMTVMFHSAAPEPWNALSDALRQAGFEAGEVLRLDKRQGSFKQVRTDGAVQGDLLIDVTRRRSTRSMDRPSPVRHELEEWLAVHMSTDLLANDTAGIRELYSHYVAECLKGASWVDVGAATFYGVARRMLRTRRDRL